MIKLRILGSPDMVGADGSQLLSVFHRPKSLALLSYLAVEGLGKYQRRDRLLGPRRGFTEEAGLRGGGLRGDLVAQRSGVVLPNRAGELVSAEVIDEPRFSVQGQRVLFSAASYLSSMSHPTYDVRSDDQAFIMLEEVAGQPDRLILVKNLFTPR